MSGQDLATTLLPARFPAFIAIRYIRAGGASRFLSFMTWVSLLGLTLGVVALIVVVSVMNGFDSELKRRILGVVPHIVVTGKGASLPELREVPGVRAASRFSTHSALLVNTSESQLVALYGIDPAAEDEMSIIPEHMVDGDMQQLLAAPSGIIIGRALAFRLGLMPGDNLTVLLPVIDVRENVRPVVINTTLAGTFRLDSELDYRLALMDVTRLQQATGVSQKALRLRVDEIFSAPEIARRLRDTHGLVVTDWTLEYGDFFRTVKMEKIMMFLLLTLIVGIAGFSIVSSLAMLVKEKQSDIAVLRTCGLSARGVTMIFVVQGVAIGIAGVILGTAIGVPLAHNIPLVVNLLESVFGARMLAGTYFDSIPTDVRYGDVVIVMLVSLSISLLATIYPAYRAASLQPAEVLRYE